LLNRDFLFKPSSDQDVHASVNKTIFDLPILNNLTMAPKEITSDSETSPFIQSHSAPLRIWHWLTFLGVIIAENGKIKGIVSGMINGNR